MPDSADAGPLAALVQQHLDQLHQKHRHRWLRPRAFGPTEPADLIDLTHNDYLALRKDEAFQAAARAALVDLPVSAGASRLLGGEHPVYGLLEDEFCAWLGAQAALYVSSGFLANLALFSALLRLPGLRFFSDALNHASLIDGLRRAKAQGQCQIFPHGDVTALSKLLAASDAAVNVIATESIFSMDGDRSDVAALGALCQAYRGVLVLDEAHAIFVHGQEGRGLAGQSGLPPSQMITVHPCGKALGGQGALIAGPFWLRDFLINTARPFIYSTGPSPWLAQALRVSLRYSSALAPRRSTVLAHSKRLRDGLSALGFDVRPSQSQIVPVRIGQDHEALRWAQALREHGILAQAVRPPTVPEGTARLRLSLHAGLSEEDVEQILNAFRKLR